MLPPGPLEQSTKAFNHPTMFLVQRRRAVSLGDLGRLRLWGKASSKLSSMFFLVLSTFLGTSFYDIHAGLVAYLINSLPIEIFNQVSIPEMPTWLAKIEEIMRPLAKAVFLDKRYAARYTEVVYVLGLVGEVVSD